VLKSIVQGFPNADISVAIIWIQMPGFDDTFTNASSMASAINDPRVRHFYDPYPSHLAGNEFARGLIAKGRGPAWDVYMFYGKDVSWDEHPPPPVAFVHQLSGATRADSARYRTGDALVAELYELMHNVVGATCLK